MDQLYTTVKVDAISPFLTLHNFKKRKKRKGNTLEANHSCDNKNHGSPTKVVHFLYEFKKNKKKKN